MRAAIIQSSYIPWKGYFDLIHEVDTFIFLDDVQFTTRDWRTRNRIKTANGPQWLTIPVGNRTDQLIHEVEIKDATWQRKHWASIRHNYGKAPFFKDYEAFFAEVYLERDWTSLSALNQGLIRHIATECLGIKTLIRDSREFPAEGKRQDRLISILQHAGASHYISGPSARNYIDPLQFEAAGITLSYHDYPSYPVYPQLYPPFEHAVSILDLLFNTGPQASYFTWGWRG
jgi:hypothetical protein